MPNSVYCVTSGGRKSVCCLNPNDVHCVYFVRQAPKAASAQAWNRLSDDRVGSLIEILFQDNATCKHVHGKERDAFKVVVADQKVVHC